MAQGKYELGAELGRGALGRVVRVRAEGGEIFAGKILHESHQADARALARFAGEANIVSELRHRNIASVHGLVEIDGEQVLLMELVDGPSLAHVIALDAPLATDRLIALATGIAEGLAAAHHRGLIHRDLKPDNILVAAADDATEVAKIVDFGLARATSFAGVDADAFAVVGTPDTMAPESIDPLAVDARSDLYALGCILYEMATSSPPFLGATAFAVLEAHRTAPLALEPLAERPGPLTEMIAALLAKSPADRPQSAAAVAEALSALQSDPADGALIPVRASSLARAASCASCGAASLPEVGVCFDCGAAQVTIEPGKFTVFVTGPGEVSDKLDSRLRQVLIDWLKANPALGLDSARLAKTVPRLPFVLATRVAESSSVRLVAALVELGFEAVARRGGRFSLEAMRKKGWKLGGRFALIGVSGLAYGLHNIVGPALIPVVALGGLVAVGGGFVSAGKPAVSQTRKPRRELPDALGRSLDRVAGVVPAIVEARHRDSLRGVVQRVLRVREVVADDQRDEVDGQLAHLLDLAVVGATRIDAIDSALAATDLRNPRDEDRAAMRERDNWAARLLEITAFLDAMRVRYISVRAAAETGGAGQSLDELRVHIEALEELSALT